ncbi:HET-domain-containing protein [Periconia macrospinosa]|uniref:HET-domain-containing protein n=1 Tax=Periconia macrospinosa TaxID=97972 RepID=A0A2V1D802_9PLEO|nr:HET-domain-containing protein [Periconia macrospinosa]
MEARGTDPTTFTNLQSALNRDGICQDCRKIRFETFLDGGRLVSRSRILDYHSIPLPQLNGDRDCKLCRFLYEVREHPSKIMETEPSYRLLVYLAAKRTFGMSPKTQPFSIFRVLPVKKEFGSFDVHDANGVIMEHDETRGSVGGRQIQPHISSSLVSQWLQLCDSNHTALCKQRFAPSVPNGFRVIDCVSRAILRWEDVNPESKYLTLSYVWGNTASDVVPDDYLDSSVVPRTIEDTIYLTIQLGYRYLWIDRYCIPQKDPENREIQLQSMDRIYEQSSITVIAAAGLDPHYGLPGIGSNTRPPQPYVHLGKKSLIYTPYATKDIATSKWNGRGWTYQEGLLSRRRLIFTEHQVYFQCNAMHCVESMNLPLEQIHEESKQRMLDTFRIGMVFPLRGIGGVPEDIGDRINEYLRRSLTKQKDILDAFKGTITAFERKFPRDFSSLCGVPILFEQRLGASYALLLALTWDGIRNRNGQVLAIPQRRVGFPSWTWLGWKASSISLATTFTNVGLNIETPSSISMEYVDGEILDWNADRHRILARNSIGSFPTILRMYGLALDVIVSKCGMIFDDIESFTRLHANSFDSVNASILQTLFQMVRKPYPKQGNDGKFVRFTLFPLCMVKGQELSTLVLYQPEGSDVFERVGVMRLWPHEGITPWYLELPRGPETPRLPDHLLNLDTAFDPSSPPNHKSPHGLGRWTPRQVRIG